MLKKSSLNRLTEFVIAVIIGACCTGFSPDAQAAKKTSTAASHVIKAKHED